MNLWLTVTSSFTLMAVTSYATNYYDLDSDDVILIAATAQAHCLHTHSLSLSLSLSLFLSLHPPVLLT